MLSELRMLLGLNPRSTTRQASELKYRFILLDLRVNHAGCTQDFNS